MLTKEKQGEIILEKSLSLPRKYFLVTIGAEASKTKGVRNCEERKMGVGHLIKGS